MDTRRIETVIVGAGQAGLATGYHLARQGRQFTILDAGRRVGDNWRCHWDSLRLYSPAKVSSLPGMPFPAPPMSFPTKDEMADYLEAYATSFELPVRSRQHVTRISRNGETFTVAANGSSIECDNIVVASGSFGRKP